MDEMLRKWFPMLMNNRGEVNTPEDTPPETPPEGETPPEETPSMEDLINEGLSEETHPEDTPPPETPPEDTEKPPETPPEDDQDFDLGYEEDGKKVTMKASEVKANLKWMKENSQTIGGAMKVRELAFKNPEFGKLLNSVIEKSVGENDSINNEYVTNSLKALEAKVENVENVIEDKDEDIEEAETILEELDPDSSQAMIMKKNIKIMKTQKAQLKEFKSSLDAVTVKLEGIDKKAADQTKSVEDAKHNESVAAHKKTFDNEYEVQTKEVKFIDDSEKQRFQNEVKKLVAGQSAKIANDEDFKKVIGESVKTVTKNLEEYHQAIKNDYLRKKGKLPKDEPKIKEIVPDELLTQESLEKELERQLMEGVEKG